jgi:YD repeat-containing protein
VWHRLCATAPLSSTGNWDRRRLDLNGDGDYTPGGDAGEIDDTGTYNKANEWLTRDTDTSGGVNFTLTHDAVGNPRNTDDGKDYAYRYDAFGRMVEVKNRATAALVAKYRYNVPGAA